MVVDGVRFFFLGGGRDHWIEEVSMSEFWRTGCTPYLVFHDGVLLYLRLALADRLDEVEVLARLEARHLRRRHGADPNPPSFFVRPRPNPKGFFASSLSAEAR